jgi:hypothetical protein
MSSAPQEPGQTPESTDTDTTSLYGDTPGDQAPEPDLSEPNFTEPDPNDPNDPELRSNEADPLPDEQASDPNSTPQGPALS